MREDSNWALFVAYDAKPLRFFEARLLGNQVWTATGALLTFGESSTETHESSAAARQSFLAHCTVQEQAGLALEREAHIDRAAPDFSMLATEIARGARRAFDSVREAHSDQTLDAYALYTDESAMTICHIAHSREALAMAARGDQDDFKWSCHEWSFADNPEALEIAYRLILLHHRDFPFQVDFQTYRAGVFEACIQALERLDQEGYFGHGSTRDDVRVLFEVSDSDDVPGANERLNPPRVYDEYRRWRESWE